MGFLTPAIWSKLLTSNTLPRQSCSQTRSDAAASFRADADVADVDQGQQAGERRRLNRRGDRIVRPNAKAPNARGFSLMICKAAAVYLPRP